MVENVLSMKEEYIKGLLCAILIPQSNWVEESRMEWNQYEEVCKIIQQIQEDSDSFDNFVWGNYFLSNWVDM